ncbi:MAG: Protein translocase subunit SecA [Microgenomates group bacterium GW2011_GWC1_41_8]|uniref:Protein translocase subunit SecA n=2 Tax=Candidatus Roizmaniibacteriota TaxID=1752723 RepID=A0A0G0T744_9BACT|nr:MAG: Protein translocase subunit SecA [Candidatus Roizmanbacteria bacterium GW2011_GWB1_40_7]KKR94176.1 MAG: Protein translocase subunit SecA [Candidatus Roizmanbacteria bacterium GW2011_GWA1_41_13]KKS24489.1 MAG: Protein translocase subunit SecA [Microgenomates group bacterium GW2011_GWC1_41_8]
MLGIFNKLFDTNAREIKKLEPVIAQINALEPEMKKLKDTDIVKKTLEFKKRLENGETLDDLLPETFALVRETASRTIGERPYDVQLISAIALHQGKVSEQKTGEGKTLSASLPLYLNSLTGKGVHLVTVNDYLARVGAGWMGPICHALGVSVSAIISQESFIYDPEYEDKTAMDWRLRFMRPVTRKEAYDADITYGVNNEFGFDYLRDNMVSRMSRRAQRGFHYAIVDEVDSVLIDEARTPHIISAPDMEATHKYYDYAKLVDRLNAETDYEIDEKRRTANLTEKGIEKLETLLNKTNLYEEDFQTLHHIEAALKARSLFKKDKEYIVRDGEVIIVDEFTGRLLVGRRFSEGLHQAIEAKEGVSIKQESKTLATVSLQNYFRMYEKLAGMTGTAATEAEEFGKIYNLEVVVVPTHRPIIRQDSPDLVYKTMKAKYKAVADEIMHIHETGQPVLVGTTSIEQNEIIGTYLKRKGVKHNLLNAKNHEQEAQIISEAGEKGAVTVATNMAGRGVDIILGGPTPNKYIIRDKKEYEKEYTEWKNKHEEVVKLSGLHVIGTERHESRRIDNQLRGRSGRQGDPGTSVFIISLEDEIMRIFGGQQIAALMTRFNLPEDQPLTHVMVSRAIEQAQIKVEGFHFDSRKHLVEYDDVLNKHREIIYGLREKIIRDDTDLKELVLRRGMVEEEFNNKEKEVSPEVIQQIIRWVYLQVIDNYWMEHLTVLEDLRQGIGLRGYAQRDPLVEYKKEAFMLFERLVQNIDTDAIDRILKVQVKMADQVQQKTPLQQAAQYAQYLSGRQTAVTPQGESKIQQEANKVRSSVHPVVSGEKKIGRNDPCPCGAINPNTGKPYKYKKCGMINALYHKLN